MTVHDPHPDSHTHGLHDGCPRCAEHAAHPTWSLDRENLANLRRRIQQGLPPRSTNEEIAMANVFAEDGAP